ncbi:MAG: GlxA family transcriptional regulator [Pseudomonadota bacterium]
MDNRTTIAVDNPGTSEGLRHYAFLLVDGFSMLCLSAAMDPLRSANRMAGSPLYRWSIISPDGQPAFASNGLELKADASIDKIPDCDILFVCAGTKPTGPELPHIMARLRERARRGGGLGALSVGSHVLAKAGLLEGYACTIHWENRASFQEEFPNVDCKGHVFEVDRNRYTAAGGTTAIDLMLHIIRQEHGAELANAVANQFQHERIRTPTDRQRSGPERDLTGKSEALRQAVELMNDNLEEPLRVADLARRVHLSMRHLERLFLRHLSMTPGRYYMRLRLERARELLRHSPAPILDIAVSVGFTSHSYFAQTYRAHFGRSPSSERRAVVN